MKSLMFIAISLLTLGLTGCFGIPMSMVAQGSGDNSEGEAVVYEVSGEM